jgi:hypothetical protein
MLRIAVCQAYLSAIVQATRIAHLTGGPDLPCRRMWQDPRFVSAAATRFAQLRAGPWSDTAVSKLIDDAAAQASPQVKSSSYREG